MSFKRKFLYLILTFALLMPVLASCGSDNETDPPPVHVHEYGEWELRKAASCGEAGRETRYCKCGEREMREIPAIPHTWVAATAYAPKTCSNCGATEGEPISLPGLTVKDVDTPIIPWG